MRRLLIAVALLSLLSCSTQHHYPAGVQPPTEAEADQALRDALSLALVRAIARASQADGFYADPRIRIDIAENPETVQKHLRQVGLDQYLDHSVLQLNRLAEATSRQARPAFIKAITAMDIGDPYELLAARDSAGTQELKDQAYGDIYAEYLPVMRTALAQSSAGNNYRKLIERYNSLPLSPDIDIDLDSYLARKSVDGLFVLMEEEEARIRQVPEARGTREIDRALRILD